jgi:tRNA/tmRNA/rRNA uracil-C5-methylase (TrmA/RlmC/RlmD family)
VSDRSGDAQIFYGPDAFGQSNLDLAMQLAHRVQQWCPPGARVTEYYAGVGAVGLGLATTASRLRLNELAEGSLRGLRHGIERLDTAASHIEVHAGAAGDHAALAAESDFVIADPPRKGLDPELTSALAAQPPPLFAYISCDLDSLERDAALLTGSLKLVELEAFDLFPHTEHVETLAIFGQSSR